MKKYFVLILVVIIAVLSVMTVCYAAPFNRYYDQDGNRYWCNSDVDGCWVTGENGEKEYIMFWSKASRDKIMGEGSNAPIGIAYNSSEMPLMAPPTAIPLITITPPPVTATPETTPVTATPETTPECTKDEDCGSLQECKDGKCFAAPCAGVTCGEGYTCFTGECEQTGCTAAEKEGLPNCGRYDWDIVAGCTCTMCSDTAKDECNNKPNAWRFNDDNCSCECLKSQDDCGNYILDSDNCTCSKCNEARKKHCEERGKTIDLTDCKCI